MSNSQVSTLDVFVETVAIGGDVHFVPTCFHAIPHWAPSLPGWELVGTDAPSVKNWVKLGCATTPCAPFLMV